MNKYLKNADKSLVKKYKALMKRKGNWKKVKATFEKWNIPETVNIDGEVYHIWNDLLIFVLFDVVFIVDDSPSTGAEFNKKLQRIMKKLGADKHLGHQRRRDFIADILEVLIDITKVLDDDGLDIVFLNAGIRNDVTSYEEVIGDIKRNILRGSTPLTKRFENVDDVAKKTKKNKNKETVVIIATDGEPTKANRNKNGKRKNGKRKSRKSGKTKKSSLVSDRKGFVKAIENRNDSTYVSIVVCTDEDDEVEYLKELDADDNKLNIMRLYHKEIERVDKTRGGEIELTVGLYVAICLLSPLHIKYDSINDSDEDYIGSSDDSDSSSSYGSSDDSDSSGSYG
jgi:hypothetical protein